MGKLLRDKTSKNQLNKLNDGCKYCKGLVGKSMEIDYCCKWKNGERLSTSARLLADLLKGFRFLHNKYPIPPEYLNAFLFWSSSILAASIVCFRLPFPASLFFLLDSMCGGDGVCGSPPPPRLASAPALDLSKLHTTIAISYKLIATTDSALASICVIKGKSYFKNNGLYSVFWFFYWFPIMKNKLLPLNEKLPRVRLTCRADVDLWCRR